LNNSRERGHKEQGQVNLASTGKHLCSLNMNQAPNSFEGYIMITESSYLEENTLSFICLAVELDFLVYIFLDRYHAWLDMINL
jgi:hypothetical protein